MASSKQVGDSFVYFIPFPTLGRILVLIFIPINTIIPLVFPLGHRDHLEFYRSNTLFLVLAILYLAVMAKLILIIGIQPRRLRARLEFDQSGVKLVPNIFMKQLGEPTIAVPIDPGTKEILICRGSQDTRSQYDSRPYRTGFRVLARSSDSRDRELKVATGNRLSAHQAMLLSVGINASTKLPIRFVQREIASGRASEIPWIPGNRP